MHRWVVTLGHHGMGDYPGSGWFPATCHVVVLGSSLALTFGVVAPFGGRAVPGGTRPRTVAVPLHCPPGRHGYVSSVHLHSTSAGGAAPSRSLGSPSISIAAPRPNAQVVPSERVTVQEGRQLISLQLQLLGAQICSVHSDPLHHSSSEWRAKGPKHRYSFQKGWRHCLAPH